MSRNMYAIARQLQVPAVKTTATFNPARLTKTLRNMVRKSIASGIHSGGWSSKTKDVRNLVFALVGETPPAYVVAHGNYIAFNVDRSLPQEVEQEIFGLLEADAAIVKMGFEEEKRQGYYRVTRAEFNAQVDDRLKLNKQRINDLKESSFSMVVPTASIRQQLVNLFAKQRSPEEVAIAERIASVLDRDEEITIPTTVNF